MTKDILINISGLQMDVDPNDPIEMMTTGAYYLRNGKQKERKWRVKSG